MGSSKLSAITVSKPKGLLMQGTPVNFVITYPLYNILRPQQCRPTSQERQLSRSAVVNILPMEIELIKRWITDLSLQGSLIEIFYRLLVMCRSQVLHIYTDGSMIKSHIPDHEQRISMGAGWVIKDTELSFKCGVEHFPSSTRPELMAILTALLAVPLHAIVIIYTDSQAVIDGNNGIMQTNSSRRILKMANNSLLGVIKQLFSLKNLDFQMVKVKGHSEIKGNDIADHLAKEAVGQVREE